MSEKRIDEALWFEHLSGHRLYPWYRRSTHHGRSAFWVSDGSNLIEDAEPVESVEDLIVHVFQQNRSIWLRAKGEPALPGLYKLDGRVLKSWGAAPNLVSLIESASRLAAEKLGDPIAKMPILIEKAVRDAGFDLITSGDMAGYYASASGSAGRVWLKPEDAGASIALPLQEPERLGLIEIQGKLLPDGMRSIGHAASPRDLYEALHAARVLMANAPASLSARVEARLAEIPTTERTREVRQRIGQDVFREALLEMWDGRCAISGQPLPARLLRASHAKPWAVAEDAERLDPFNGLLLAVHYDALFDSGLIAVADSGVVMVSASLDAASKRVMGLIGEMKVEGLRPGHLQYLAYHRRFIAPWTQSTV